jgi:hypothetical protein
MRNLGFIELLIVAAIYGVGILIVWRFYRALASIGEELRGIRAILGDR